MFPTNCNLRFCWCSYLFSNSVCIESLSSMNSKPIDMFKVMPEHTFTFTLVSISFTKHDTFYSFVSSRHHRSFPDLLKCLNVEFKYFKFQNFKLKFSQTIVCEQCTITQWKWVLSICFIGDPINWLSYPTVNTNHLAFIITTITKKINQMYLVYQIMYWEQWAINWLRKFWKAICLFKA